MKRLSLFSFFMFALIHVSLFSNMAQATWHDMINVDNAKKLLTIENAKKAGVYTFTGVAGFIGLNTGYNGVDMLADMYKNSPEFVKNFGGFVADKTGLSILSHIPVNPRYVGALVGAGYSGNAVYKYFTEGKKPAAPPIVFKRDSSGSWLKTLGNGFSSAASLVSQITLGQCAAVFTAAVLYHQYQAAQQVLPKVLSK